MIRASLSILVAGALLAGCATRAPQPGTVVATDRFTGQVVPGRTTRAELVAAFGQTRSVVFDSGYEAWLYSANAPGGRSEEVVVLLDREGIVRKLRRRPPYPTDPQR